MSGIGVITHQGVKFALGVDGYQFTSTTSNPVRVDNAGSVYYFGSGSFVRNPLNQVSGSLFGVEGLKIKPIGSTLHQPPEDEDGNKLWKFFPNPQQNPGSEIIQNAYNTILQYDNSYFLGGASSQQRFSVKASFQVDEEGNPLPTLSSYKVRNCFSYKHPTNHLLCFLGSKMPMRPVGRALTLQTPRLIKSKARFFPLGIDIDYVQQVWTMTAQSLVFGDREFVIYSTMDGKFHAFPLESPISEEEENIASIYIQSIEPTYPDWVSPFVNVREYTEANNHPPLNPIISWSINQAGNRAIGCLIERTTHSGNLKDQVLLDNGSYPDFRSEEFELEPPKVFAEQGFFGSGDSEPLQTDRIGVVELSFSLIVTGEELQQFYFEINVVKNEPPVDGTQVRVGIVFAKPVLQSPLIADSIVELFMEFYRTPEQILFAKALDGMYGSENPQFGRWVFKVNGTETLAFPMQAFLDENNAPIPFSCMKHLVKATTIYTQLENLDLGTLSFYRTVRYRKPTLTQVPRTSGGGGLFKTFHYTKVCAIRVDAFANGSIVDTQYCGNEASYPNIDAYLALTAPETMVAWSSDDLDTLRGNYRSYSTKPLSSGTFLGQGRIGPQWWAHVLFWPMWYVLAEMMHKQAAGEYAITDPDSSPQISNGGCSSNYIPISQLTSENFEVEFWNKVMSFNNASTDISSIYTLIHTAHGGRINSSDAWPIIPMLKTANPDWNEDTTEIKWLAEQVVLDFKELVKDQSHFADWQVFNGVLTARYNFTTYETITGMSFAYFHSSDGQFNNSVDPFFKIDSGYGHSFTDHFVLRNYPWVWHFVAQNYNQLLIARGRNEIMIHPNGHTSIMRDYLYCPTGSEPEGQYIANSIWWGTDKHPDSPITDYRTEFKETALPEVSERNGLMVDRLSFWSKTTHPLETSHVVIHNMAFGLNEQPSDYHHTASPQIYSDWTSEQEPLVVYGGFRQPTHYFNNLHLRMDISAEASTIVKDNYVSLSYPRIAPLWGQS